MNVASQRLPKRLDALSKSGIVTVETRGSASFPDESYRSAGCKIADTSSQIWGECDIVLKVRSPSDEEIEHRPETTLISFRTAQNPDLLEKIAARGIRTAIEAVHELAEPNSMRFIDANIALLGSR